MATSYMGHLKNRKPHMLKEHEFHIAKKATSSGSSAPSTPPHATSAAASPKKDSRRSKDRSHSREKSVSAKLSPADEDKKRRSSKSRERSRDSTSKVLEAKTSVACAPHSHMTLLYVVSGERQRGSREFDVSVSLQQQSDGPALVHDWERAEPQELRTWGSRKR